MGVVRKTVSLPDELDAWVKSEVASGQFTSDSEVHRAALLEKQQRQAKIAWLQSELEKSANSPLIDQTPREIIAELKTEMRASGEL